jgi:hypothetical protein
MEMTMQKILIAATLAAIAVTSVAPVAAMTLTGGLFDASILSPEFDRRRPRVPGGSGCDDPRDLIEHPKACTPV